MLARRLCSGCGLDYNLMAHRPEVPDRCDVCGAPLVARDDDHPEALAARLRDYREKTEPVIGLFRRKEFVVELDATNSVEAIQVELRQRLGLPVGDVSDVPPAQPISDSL